SHDRELERNADLLLRGLDEVAVGVGEDRELPAVGADLPERLGNLRKRPPARQRARKRVLLAGGRAELAHRLGQHLAVGALSVGFQLRLELVVATEQLVGALLAEHASQLAPDPAVPVDQRAVAVEGCPPVPRHEPSLRAVLRAFSSPSAIFSTRVSLASPSGVEVPCALM